MRKDTFDNPTQLRKCVKNEWERKTREERVTTLMKSALTDERQ